MFLRLQFIKCLHREILLLLEENNVLYSLISQLILINRLFIFLINRERFTLTIVGPFPADRHINSRIQERQQEIWGRQHFKIRPLECAASLSRQNLTPSSSGIVWRTIFVFQLECTHYFSSEDQSVSWRWTKALR